MGTVNTLRTDLYALHDYIQNTLLVHPKAQIIEALREFFSQDSYFHFVRDEWGFPKTPDLTDVELEAGLNDDVTTRVFIGEQYRYDIIYYPAILVRNSSSKFVPLSFNNNKDTVQYDVVRFVDGYGNETFTSTPSHIINAGAWEGTINIDVITRSHGARDELAAIVKLFLVDTRRWELQNAGVFVKGASVGAFSEVDDRTDKLFKCTISCDIRTEWRRHIPVSNIVDAINICVDFGNLQTRPHVIAPNIRVTSLFNLSDALMDS